IVIPYEGDAKQASVVLKNGTETIPSIVTKFPEKDSLQVWFRPLKADSLSVSISQDKFKKDFNVRIKDSKRDTLGFSPKQSGILHFRDRFAINSLLPVASIDNSKIQLSKKDSSAVAFKTAYDAFTQNVYIDFEKEPLEEYHVKLLPGALKDYLDTANDTLNYSLKTLSIAEYANMNVVLKNVKRFPVIVELANAKGEVVASEYSEGSTQITFSGLQPARLLLRAIYDDNKNKAWDTGSYLEKRLPEEVIYYKNASSKDEIDVRANWEMNQDFDLSQ
ncbi:MAG TPA: hypothetical protein VFR70_01700, partial [Flavobacterium sp.]|nr:hypothetical protein [Flavobacterium sp.]